MACKFCLWLRNLFHIQSGPDCNAFWDSVWNESEKWEAAHSDESEVWARESDDSLDRIAAASDIFEADPEAAFRAYLALAEAGSVWSMQTVAWHYHTGSGVPSDFERAQEYYRRAISAGARMATIGYSRLLAAHGYYGHCEKILEGGVEAGFLPAYFWLAWFRYEQSRSRRTCRMIKPLLEYAADKGHPGATVTLARLMMVGKFGLRQIPRGFRLIRERFPQSFGEQGTEERRASNARPRPVEAHR